MPTVKDLLPIITTLRKKTAPFTEPLVDQIIAEFGHDPYLILISCLLSLRARDTTTIHVCRDLFTRACTPEKIAAMPRHDLERIIFKTGFYRNKAKVLQEVSLLLLAKYDGKVPDTLDALLAINGVGRKTANLVLGLAYGVPSICVDTHVHRISNRLGLIATRTPDATEVALMNILPQQYWIEWNKLLVVWGQNMCVPIKPKCSKCPVKPYCKRVGVIKSC